MSILLYGVLIHEPGVRAEGYTLQISNMNSVKLNKMLRAWVYPRSPLSCNTKDRNIFIAEIEVVSGQSTSNVEDCGQMSQAANPVRQ
jgi:hypothetical protein